MTVYTCMIIKKLKWSNSCRVTYTWSSCFSLMISISPTAHSFRTKLIQVLLLSPYMSAFLKCSPNIWKSVLIHVCPPVLKFPPNFWKKVSLDVLQSLYVSNIFEKKKCSPVLKCPPILLPNCPYMSLYMYIRLHEMSPYFFPNSFYMGAWTVYLSSKTIILK
jgi:hypothetical protein